ncbi:RDD family protein [Rhodocytophaga rosea]|uniref:RDD family protein n=1 Tax=Rhodocytophaga rosea TaxID=2704465 RepID=A0A6C0GUK1_9BACT|nr:RDD family protein [Rhodocytophaga rosea]QHT71878.1 RDD family protein [Rhodocytophaga rosea]
MCQHDLDLVFFYVIFIGIGIVWEISALISTDASDTTTLSDSLLLNYLLPSIMLVAYYTFFEYKFGKTIGKMITNTKVVRKDGGKPTLKNILGRSFARLIPFEPLSLIGSHLPVGLHDSIADTLVVDDIALYNIEKAKEKTEESF